MNGVVRAFMSGAAGVFVTDLLAPKLESVFKPDSDFARKAMRAGAAGLGTGIAYWALGAFTGKAA